MIEVFEKFDNDNKHRIQAIFASVFVMQNRMQTACEKIQTEISMKQWLLLAMTTICEKPHTLTNIGNLMGCSRQNVKKLSVALEEKGYIRLVQSNNNSVCIELTEQVYKYMKGIELRHAETLKLLFMDFTEKEIDQLYRLYQKLYSGLERVEKYAKGLDE